MSVVRHEDGGFCERGQVILEPQHRRKVEVIRGLVKEKEFGFCEQCHGQRDAHAPSTRQGFGSLLEQVWSELQTSQDSGPARLGLCRADLLQTIAHFLQSPRVFPARLGQEFSLLLFEHRQLEIAIHQGLQWCPIVTCCFLLHVQHLQILGKSIKGIAGDGSEKRTLACTIAPHQAVTTSTCELQIGAAKQRDAVGRIEVEVAHLHVRLARAHLSSSRKENGQRVLLGKLGLLGHLVHSGDLPVSNHLRLGCSRVLAATDSFHGLTRCTIFFLNGDAPTLDVPPFFAHLVDELLIVSHNNAATAKTAQRLLQRFNRFHVKVIRGLVEAHDVRLRPESGTQHQLALLPRRQHGDRAAARHVLGQAKGLQMLHDLASRQRPQLRACGRTCNPLIESCGHPLHPEDSQLAKGFVRVLLLVVQLLPLHFVHNLFAFFFVSTAITPPLCHVSHT
mmetsp:Transcript_2460/g.7226  ORF Transcript_2460/g.7226 Transcript_2460/m.7226 type:complete len:449 (-) Transcript_2460:1574-2920(-)